MLRHRIDVMPKTPKRHVVQMPTDMKLGCQSTRNQQAQGQLSYKVLYHMCHKMCRRFVRYSWMLSYIQDDFETKSILWKWHITASIKYCLVPFVVNKWIFWALGQCWVPKFFTLVPLPFSHSYFLSNRSPQIWNEVNITPNVRTPFQCFGACVAGLRWAVYFCGCVCVVVGRGSIPWSCQTVGSPPRSESLTQQENKIPVSWLESIHYWWCPDEINQAWEVFTPPSPFSSCSNR